MFSLNEISLNVGKKALLTNVSASFECGTLTAILGPNGAGKSTLIKCLAGVAKPSLGDVFYCGKSLRDLKDEKRAILRAYMNQQINSSFDYNVEDIVMMGRFPHYNYKPSKADYTVVNEAMDLAEISHLKNRTSSLLSGGELQRVHFARALAQVWPKSTDDCKEGHGKLLLLDEPVNNLDPQYQHLILKTAKKFAVYHNMAVVTVLHDLNLAALYAHKAVLLDKGRLVGKGTIEETLTEEVLEDLYKIPISIIKKYNYINIVTGFKVSPEIELYNKEIVNF